MQLPTGPAARAIGTILCRAVVPGWILTGAIFKLVERTPKNLPKNTILAAGAELGIDLNVLLRTLIGLEFIAALIMILVARWARPTAVIMLLGFCAILIGEMVQGNVTSCGCFGKVPIAPWQMLIIDGSLLAGTIVFQPRAGLTAGQVIGARISTAHVLTGLGAMVASFAVAFGVPEIRVPVSNVTDGETPGDSAGDAGRTAPAGGQNSAAVRRPLPPPSTYLPRCDSWVGKRWEELDIAQYMSAWPTGFAEGTRYVVFYGKSCEHCHELFTSYFAGSMPAPTTAVAVPENKTGFDPPSMAMPCTECELLELPIGCDWIITTPILVRLEDGVVACAREGEDPADPQCLPH
jgi:hypothetical protein